MTADSIPSTPGSPATAVDRVQIIRRSMRCFIFGLIGVVPFLGIALACLAFGLGRRVVEQTGDRISFQVPGLSWMCGLFLAYLYLIAIGTNAAIAVILVFLGLQGYLLFSQFRNFSPREWNPARHLLFWGLGLAYTGIAVSAGCIIFILIIIAVRF